MAGDPNIPRPDESIDDGISSMSEASDGSIHSGELASGETSESDDDISCQVDYDGLEEINPYPWFDCNECQLAFPTLESLALHNGKHTRFFKCQLCTKSFVRVFELKRHELNVHRLTLDCQLCSNKYVRMNNLTLHLEKVHGMKRCNSQRGHGKK